MDLKGEWNQIRSEWGKLSGRIRSRWDKLTEHDVQEAQGDRDKLVQKLQERYGMSKQQAEQEVEQLRKEAAEERTRTSGQA